MLTSKFATVNALFVNVNKRCVPMIVPEQSKSASFVTLVEIRDVDVPTATVLLPIAGIPQWPSAIVVLG